MAELESALVTIMKAHSGLNALINKRVYPLLLPQNPTYPAVVYQRIDTTRESGMTQDHGMAHPRIQIDCYGSTYASALSVGVQMKALFAVGGARYANASSDPVILDAECEDEADEYEDEVGVYRRRMDFIIWHRE